MVTREEFFTNGQGSIHVRDFLELWDQLEVVVECVMELRGVILNHIVMHVHINGLMSTPMSLKFMYVKMCSTRNEE